MTRQKFTLAVAATFALSLAPAWAQENRPSQDQGPARSSGGGEPVGRAVERSSPAPSPSSDSGSSGSSSSGSSGSSSSRPSWDGPSGNMEAPRRSDAPRRYDAPERSEQRRGSGGGSGERAVPRGSGGSSGSGGTASTRGESGAEPNRAPERSAVPVYARPREGRPAVGVASERRTPINRGGIDVLYIPSSYYFYDPYYSRSRLYANYWLPGYGFGLGYFGYDPFYWGHYGGYYDPYAYGGGGYSGYGGYSGSGYGARYATGSLRLKVKPSNAQVYVDGYFVGVVDSFDGMFQKLAVEAGTHRIEIRAEGYEPVQFEVMVTPDETITYKGEMIRRQP